MSDHMLLRAAARAAGYSVRIGPNYGELERQHPNGVWYWWNPLMHTDAAFELADAMRMIIRIDDDAAQVTAVHAGRLETMGAVFRPGRDRIEVLRYAIVRLAALFDPTLTE